MAKMIPFICPHCAALNLAPETWANQTKLCPSCGKAVTVSAANESAEPNVAPGALQTRSTGLGMQVLAICVLAVIGAVCVVVVGYELFRPAVAVARRASPRTQCCNNLKSIGLAFHQYYQKYDSFPPAYIADKNGRPKHSWRVLILPFVEQQALYDQYNFNEPWNSPSNLLVARRMPEVYACPDCWRPGWQTTAYQVIAGSETMFPGPNATTIGEVKDGLSNTLMVVESAQSQVFWTQPVDLRFDKMRFIVAGGPGEIQSDHSDGVNVLIADGSVGELQRGDSPSRVRALATRKGGEATWFP